ncbi:carboxymuconolactone decarboxylase family protein [Saccharopolyspora rosea]|uniref:Carboxymuconolactone decarboxylase family protein n=1 Tax=Saccharopolyspora rosea TaxID=524884 RepID=A0ABW3FMT9_9PSEU|nr:carboxymuconolactone decarboxylase family protein [Saccharopolyspora rosea]
MTRAFGPVPAESSPLPTAPQEPTRPCPLRSHPVTGIPTPPPHPPPGGRGRRWSPPWPPRPRSRPCDCTPRAPRCEAHEQLTYHLGLARDNGLSEDELTEVITHLAFYAGWPKAMSAMAVAKQVFRSA